MINWIIDQIPSLIYMAKLQKAQNLSLVEDVTRQIEEAILDGEYKPGDKLPSTRELQKILGASLGTVRESLTKLEQKGLLKVLKGAKGGFFVREITISSMMDSLETLMKHMVLSHRELYEFRATIEAGLVRLVVKRASNQQIKKIKKYLNKLKNCLNISQLKNHFHPYYCEKKIFSFSVVKFKFF